MLQHSSRRHRFIEAKLQHHHRENNSTGLSSSGNGSGHRERWRLSRLRGDSPHGQVHDQDEPPVLSELPTSACDVKQPVTCSTSTTETETSSPATTATAATSATRCRCHKIFFPRHRCCDKLSAVSMISGSGAAFGLVLPSNIRLA
jgi:hypothetical protein